MLPAEKYTDAVDQPMLVLLPRQAESWFFYILRFFFGAQYINGDLVLPARAN